jgi:hypothetical protein
MAATIQIKRSQVTATPSSLAAGELAWSDNSSTLFVGNAAGNAVVAVGGSGVFATLASPTFTGTPAAPTAGASTNTTQVATTAFVHAWVPLTTTGDLLYADGTNSTNRLAGNATTTKKFLTQTGNGSASAAPSWSTIAGADVPVFGASGGSHSVGAVPDPGSSSGTTKFLREDATWAVPGGGGTVTSVTAGNSTITIGGTASDPTVAVATGGITNTQVAAGAAIAYSKLNLSASIVNADIASGAAIALSKLATDPLARANHTGTQTASTISDFDTQVRTSTLNQMTAPTADLSINSHKLTNVSDPTSAQDAATKAYVDAIRQGLDVKDSARVATAAALPSNSRTGNALTASANGALTVDGVTVAVADRVLVKNEATGANNGLYAVTATGDGSNPFVLTRSSDADISAEVTGGLFVFVAEGTVNADSGWVLTTNDPITLNTTALAFAQFSGAGQITDGNGLAKTGNTLDVNVDSRASGTKTTAIVSDEVRIDSAWVGQTSITTLGTVTTATIDGGTF